MGRHPLRLPGSPADGHHAAGDALTSDATPDQRAAHALLDRIAATALDDDYYVYRGVRRQVGVVRKLSFAAVLAVIGAVVAAAAVGLRQQNASSEVERQALIADVTESHADQTRNQAIASHLRDDVATLERERGIDIPESNDLSLITGAASTSGPGVTVTVDNGSGPDGLVTDADLQLLVNGLWYAGAEAVSVDGERVGSLTSIRSAGAAVTVNFRSIRAPYEVLAIGNADAMLARFGQSPVGAYWEARHRRAHVRFDMEPSSGVALPPVPDRRLDVTHAHLLAGPGGDGGRS